jgi:2-polyprenyl-6-methoxyphenol hydroxylase-like FAD-dependent oxidoreductase
LTLRALVVGGGIGGLAAAVALRQAGVETVVLEQARVLEGVGYGLALSPNALLALEHLGLANAVCEHGAPPERICIRSSNGRTINEVDLKAAGLEMLGVHRADLQTVRQRLQASRSGSTLESSRFGRRTIGLSRNSRTEAPRKPIF